MSDAVRCPACGSTDVASQLQVSEMMFGLDETFRYLECADCRSIRLSDVPQDMGPYYPTDYYSVDLDPERIFGSVPVRTFTRVVARSRLLRSDRVADAACRALRRRQFRTLMSILDSVRLAGLARGPQTRVLDVGCGSGMLIYALSLAGVRGAVGTDPFAPGDRTFRTGARILKRDLADVAAEGPFDLVMFHHSLEHVPDPGESLRQAATLLAPGGRILVRMPTVSSQAFEDYGSSWVQLDAPRHLTLFSREGLDRLCRSIGLTIVADKDDSTAFQFWGSEQVKAGVALNAPDSYMVSPGDSAFAGPDVRSWEQEARRLNAHRRGDQAAWVLAPTG